MSLYQHEFHRPTWGWKGALANYLGPETGGNLLVGPTRWDSRESGTDSRNPKNRQHGIDEHIPPQKLGCLVSGMDPIRSPFRTCSCPVLWLLITHGVVSTLIPVTELNSWLPHSTLFYLMRSSKGVLTSRKKKKRS